MRVGQDRMKSQEMRKEKQLEEIQRMREEKEERKILIKKIRQPNKSN